MADTADQAGGTTGTERCDAGDEDVVEEDVLVEEVSIDGMCGVY
jgi:mycofactocin precursor